jgi:phage tail-like protein
MDDDYPPTSFNFVVLFEPVRFEAGWGKGDASFSEAGGIGPEMEVESYREGGENRFVHSLPKGVKHPKLTLKRGVAPKGSQLVKWCRTVLQGGLAKPIHTRNLGLYLLAADGSPLRGWTFQNAYPTHWTVDNFVADKNSVAVEKIELSYATSARDF